MDFDYHFGIEGWSSSNEESDFDLCEMCIRWVLHCEKNKVPHGWTEEDPAKEPEEDAAGEEPYLTSRSHNAEPEESK